MTMPACIAPGNDRVHPRVPGQVAHRLMPNAEYHEVFAEDRLDLDVARELWDAKEGLLAAIFIDFLDARERGNQNVIGTAPRAGPRNRSRLALPDAGSGLAAARRPGMTSSLRTGPSGLRRIPLRRLRYGSSAGSETWAPGETTHSTGSAIG